MDRQDQSGGQGSLTKEIGYWDHRAEKLKLQEQAGRANARLNSQERRRADELQARSRSAWSSWTWKRRSRPCPGSGGGGACWLLRR